MKRVGEGKENMRSPARRRDVPTPVIGKLSLSHLGIVAVRVEPRAEEAGARETLRSVLETSLNAEVTTLSAAIREEEAVKEEAKRGAEPMDT